MLRCTELHTINMPLYELWYLVKYQALQIYLSQSALQLSRAMCYYSDHLLHECLIRCYFPVPAVHEILYHDSNDSVQLQVDFIATRQGGKQLVEWSRVCSMTVRTENTFDKSCGSFIEVSVVVTERPGEE